MDLEDVEETSGLGRITSRLGKSDFSVGLHGCFMIHMAIPQVALSVRRASVPASGVQSLVLNVSFLGALADVDTCSEGTGSFDRTPGLTDPWRW